MQKMSAEKLYLVGPCCRGSPALNPSDCGVCMEGLIVGEAGSVDSAKLRFPQPAAAALGHACYPA